MEMKNATGNFAVGWLERLCEHRPQHHSKDRFDYITAISDSGKSQMLLNVVKLRYGDTPVFLDMSSVINQYTVEASGVL